MGPKAQTPAEKLHLTGVTSFTSATCSLPLPETEVDAEEEAEAEAEAAGGAIGTSAHFRAFNFIMRQQLCNLLVHCLKWPGGFQFVANKTFSISVFPLSCFRTGLAQIVLFCWLPRHSFVSGPK